MIVSHCLIEKMINTYHYPVMHRKVIEILQLKNKKIIVDCTVGMASHALRLLTQMDIDSHLIGIDKDEDSLILAQQNLDFYNKQTTLIKSDFSDIDKVLQNLKIQEVDAFLFDLGISLYQLTNPQRGFSFLEEGPLDMRMDQNSFVSAYDLVNNLSEQELGNIFKQFGEERYYKKVAHAVVQTRKSEPIATTTQLADIISRTIGSKYRAYKIHPATRAFQALRIAVNRELPALEAGLRKSITFLRKGGRIVVISFHSLEDRIVKLAFREHAAKGLLKIITKKPITPDDLELKENPASRSAKLRVAEKI